MDLYKIYFIDISSLFSLTILLCFFFLFCVFYGIYLWIFFCLAIVVLFTFLFFVLVIQDMLLKITNLVLQQKKKFFFENIDFFNGIIVCGRVVTMLGLFFVCMEKFPLFSFCWVYCEFLMTDVSSYSFVCSCQGTKRIMRGLRRFFHSFWV